MFILCNNFLKTRIIPEQTLFLGSKTFAKINCSRKKILPNKLQNRKNKAMWLYLLFAKIRCYKDKVTGWEFKKLKINELKNI